MAMTKKEQLIEQLIEKVNNLQKSDTYKKWIIKIINLSTSYPEKYDIGVVSNCTIYVIKEGKKIPVVYLFLEGSGITIQSQDNTGKEMDDIYFSATVNLKEQWRIRTDKKLFYSRVISEQDAENLYNGIISL